MIGLRHPLSEYKSPFVRNAEVKAKERAKKALSLLKKQKAAHKQDVTLSDEWKFDRGGALFDPNLKKREIFILKRASESWAEDVWPHSRAESQHRSDSAVSNSSAVAHHPQQPYPWRTTTTNGANTASHFSSARPGAAHLTAPASINASNAAYPQSKTFQPINADFNRHNVESSSTSAPPPPPPMKVTRATSPIDERIVDLLVGGHSTETRLDDDRHMDKPTLVSSQSYTRGGRSASPAAVSTARSMSVGAGEDSTDRDVSFISVMSNVDSVIDTISPFEADRQYHSRRRRSKGGDKDRMKSPSSSSGRKQKLLLTSMRRYRDDDDDHYKENHNSLYQYHRDVGKRRADPESGMMNSAARLLDAVGDIVRASSNKIEKARGKEGKDRGRRRDRDAAWVAKAIRAASCNTASGAGTGIAGNTSNGDAFNANAVQDGRTTAVLTAFTAQEEGGARGAEGLRKMTASDLLDMVLSKLQVVESQENEMVAFLQQNQQQQHQQRSTTTMNPSHSRILSHSEESDGEGISPRGVDTTARAVDTSALTFLPPSASTTVAAARSSPYRVLPAAPNTVPITGAGQGLSTLLSSSRKINSGQHIKARANDDDDDNAGLISLVDGIFTTSYDTNKMRKKKRQQADDKDDFGDFDLSPPPLGVLIDLPYSVDDEENDPDKTSHKGVGGVGLGAEFLAFRRELDGARTLKEAAFRCRGYTLAEATKTLSDSLLEQLISSVSDEIDGLLSDYAENIINKL